MGDLQNPKKTNTSFLVDKIELVPKWIPKWIPKWTGNTETAPLVTVST